MESQFEHLKHNHFFRTGPEFLSSGIEEAIQNKNLVPMQSIKKQVEKEILDTILEINPENSNDIDTNSHKGH